MEPSDLIWMNGDFVAWEDAKVHVLTHGLHYGTGVFEGIRAYDTELGTADLPPPGPPRPALQVGRAVLHADSVPARGARGGHARADRPQRPDLLLHPPDRLPRLRPDGPVPARGARSTWRSPCGAGAPTWARRASGPASAPRSPRGGASAPDSLIPQSKASGQYLNSVLAKIESQKAGYEEAILLDDHGNVCEGSGENIFVVRDGRRSSRPRRARASSTASTASR